MTRVKPITLCNPRKLKSEPHDPRVMDKSVDEIISFFKKNCPPLAFLISVFASLGGSGPAAEQHEVAGRPAETKRRVGWGMGSWGSIRKIRD